MPARLLFVAGMAVASLLGQAAFEVTSVKPYNGPLFRSGPPAVSGTLVRAEGYTLFGLILDAYGIRDFQIATAPRFAFRADDLYDARYSIEARAPGETAPSPEQVRVMLQNLLAERFHLRLHRQSRVSAVYVMTVRTHSPALHSDTSGKPCRDDTHAGIGGNSTEEEFIGCPILRLAERLTNRISGGPVIDRTRLEGNYDFRITVPADAEDATPHLIAESLGLRLTAQRLPIEILVIDGFSNPDSN
jgi:uncharacterized protein (TIGR03435 family)